MPNWCQNTVRFSSKDSNELERLKDKLKGTLPIYNLSASNYPLDIVKESKKEKECLFSFHEIIPVPDDVLEDGFHTRGYKWQIQNWGTKWSPSSVHLEESNFSDGKLCELLYTFDTAWSPSKEVLYEIVKLFPEVTMTYAYAEPGIGFYGSLEYRPGEEVSDNYYVGLASEVIEEAKLDSVCEDLIYELQTQKEFEEEYLLD